MKSIVLLLLLAIAVTLVVSRPSGNEPATLTNIKPKEEIMVKDDFKKGKRHVSHCKNKVRSTSFSLQTRLVNIAIAKSSVSKHGSLHHHYPHTFVPGLDC